jgi:hypothetical protein
MKSKEISKKEIIAKLILALLLQIIPFIGSATTLNWPKAWLYLVIYFSFAITLVSWQLLISKEFLG